MITEKRAVELVESLLAQERLTWMWRGPIPDPAVYHVEEHALGWVVSWNTAEFARTRDLKDRLVGSGPYLVDRQDGSIHHIPVTTWVTDGWEALYLRQIKGIRPPDPLASTVRELARSAGPVAAMAHLRRRAPRLSLHQARAYLLAVRHGAEPPEELADLTEEEVSCPLLPIETLRRAPGADGGSDRRPG
ncbi:YrhB domain-containing protein [Kitasatospora sp. NPDC004669]|uniref:YrhB domain-containing protein n=1 Tax=Kitasatospora sp. NPDC004669 TaxID=3154555 RepID=UPI00339F63F2